MADHPPISPGNLTRPRSGNPRWACRCGGSLALHDGRYHFMGWPAPPASVGPWCWRIWRRGSEPMTIVTLGIDLGKTLNDVWAWVPRGGSSCAGVSGGQPWGRACGKAFTLHGSHGGMLWRASSRGLRSRMCAPPPVVYRSERTSPGVHGCAHYPKMTPSRNAQAA